MTFQLNYHLSAMSFQKHLLIHRRLFTIIFYSMDILRLYSFSILMFHSRKTSACTKSELLQKYGIVLHLENIEDLLNTLKSLKTLSSVESFKLSLQDLKILMVLSKSCLFFLSFFFKDITKYSPKLMF